MTGRSEADDLLKALAYTVRKHDWESMAVLMRRLAVADPRSADLILRIWDGIDADIPTSACVCSCGIACAACEETGWVLCPGGYCPDCCDAADHNHHMGPAEREFWHDLREHGTS